jgi:hypothetical protein
MIDGTTQKQGAEWFSASKGRREMNKVIGAIVFFNVFCNKLKAETVTQVFEAESLSIGKLENNTPEGAYKQAFSTAKTRSNKYESGSVNKNIVFIQKENDSAIALMVSEDKGKRLVGAKQIAHIDFDKSASSPVWGFTDFEQVENETVESLVQRFKDSARFTVEDVDKTVNIVSSFIADFNGINGYLDTKKLTLLARNLIVDDLGSANLRPYGGVYFTPNSGDKLGKLNAMKNAFSKIGSNVVIIDQYESVKQEFVQVAEESFTSKLLSIQEKLDEIGTFTTKKKSETIEKEIKNLLDEAGVYEELLGATLESFRNSYQNVLNVHGEMSKNIQKTARAPRKVTEGKERKIAPRKTQSQVEYEARLSTVLEGRKRMKENGLSDEIIDNIMPIPEPPEPVQLDLAESEEVSININQEEVEVDEDDQEQEDEDQEEFDLADVEEACKKAIKDAMAQGEVVFQFGTVSADKARNPKFQWVVEFNGQRSEGGDMQPQKALARILADLS